MALMDFNAMILTEEDVRRYIREALSKMRYDDLMDVLSQLPASEEKQWLQGLIFEELGSLVDRGKFIV
jgi:Mg/Co/Ni transporter MgtE